MIAIEEVRKRFIKHFDGKTGNIYFSPGVSTSSENTPTITVDSSSQVLLTKV